MAKKTGTKHHVVIKLEDLNKMFKGSDVIPVPKGFVKSIGFQMSAHNVSLADIAKDTALPPSLEAAPAQPRTEEPALQITETEFSN
jgi:hypothetical protein